MNIAYNLDKVLQRIDESVNKLPNKNAQVALLAVSKTRSWEKILQAYEQGQRHFGESYVQESIEKINKLKDYDICWHFIGPIQSNKTNKIAQHYDWVHSVDRVKIAQRLSDQRPDNMPPINVCVQLNISNEDSKSGAGVEQLLELAQIIDKLPNLTLRGLMAIPQKLSDYDSQTKTFAELHNYYQQMRKQFDTVDTLSMGMSQDLEAAIAEGSNMVRIGTDIFGPRD